MKINIEHKIWGSLTDVQGDVVVSYTSGVSSQLDALETWIPSPVLSANYASLLGFFYPSSKRYTFVHTQGAHVKFPSNARQYATRAIYEIEPTQMLKLNYDFESLLSFLPRMARFNERNVGVNPEVDIKQLPSYSLSDQEQLLLSALQYSIYEDKQLAIVMSDTSVSAIENDLFEHPLLKMIAHVVDHLPINLRKFASFAFSVDDNYREFVPFTQIVCCYPGSDNLFIEAPVVLKWSDGKFHTNGLIPSVDKNFDSLANLVSESFLGDKCKRRLINRSLKALRDMVDSIVGSSVLTSQQMNQAEAIYHLPVSSYKYVDVCQRLGENIIAGKQHTVSIWDLFPVCPGLLPKLGKTQFLDEIDAVKEKYPDAYAKMQPEARKLVKKMSLSERLSRINKPIYGITAVDILPSSWNEYYKAYLTLHDKYPVVFKQVSRTFSRWEKRELTDAIWSDVKDVFSEDEKKKLREMLLLDYFEKKQFSFIFEGKITPTELSYIASYYFKQKRYTEFVRVYETYSSKVDTLKEFALPYFKLKWSMISPKCDPLEDKILCDMLISRDIDSAESLKLALSDSLTTLPRIINILSLLSDHCLLSSDNEQEVHNLLSKALDADMSLSSCAALLCVLPTLSGFEVKLSDFKIKSIGKDADKYINRLEKSAYSSYINAFKEKKMELLMAAKPRTNDQLCRMISEEEFDVLALVSKDEVHSMLFDTLAKQYYFKAFNLYDAWCSKRDSGMKKYCPELSESIHAELNSVASKLGTSLFNTPLVFASEAAIWLKKGSVPCTAFLKSIESNLSSPDRCISAYNSLSDSLLSMPNSIKKDTAIMTLNPYIQLLEKALDKTGHEDLIPDLHKLIAGKKKRKSTDTKLSDEQDNSFVAGLSEMMEKVISFGRSKTGRSLLISLVVIFFISGLGVVYAPMLFGNGEDNQVSDLAEETSTEDGPNYEVGVHLFQSDADVRFVPLKSNLMAVMAESFRDSALADKSVTFDSILVKTEDSIIVLNHVVLGKIVPSLSRYIHVAYDSLLRSDISYDDLTFELKSPIENKKELVCDSQNPLSRFVCNNYKNCDNIQVDKVKFPDDNVLDIPNKEEFRQLYSDNHTAGINTTAYYCWLVVYINNYCMENNLSFNFAF